MVESIRIAGMNNHRVTAYESSSTAHSTSLSNVINLSIIKHVRPEHHYGDQAGKVPSVPRELR